MCHPLCQNIKYVEASGYTCCYQALRPNRYIKKKIAFQAEEQSKLELLSKSNAFKRVDN